jgi:hypothetical protein
MQTWCRRRSTSSGSLKRPGLTRASAKRKREGQHIYQLAAFSINDFHPEAAKQMFLKRLGVASRDSKTVPNTRRLMWGR